MTNLFQRPQSLKDMAFNADLTASTFISVSGALYIFDGRIIKRICFMAPQGGSQTIHPGCVLLYSLAFMINNKRMGIQQEKAWRTQGFRGYQILFLLLGGT
ncbi:hypothetical protein L1987_76023 [Smallanthus sonchifolius]|uniref:Uncharacterized protein n=1 Tax=Smallanthus sonchifolius TaxID=185202 RepID=A0ACB9A7P2_9ASTR|nr:hypothetical protein L1987_76023 [Smallanthus sonchifolius]